MKRFIIVIGFIGIISACKQKNMAEIRGVPAKSGQEIDEEFDEIDSDADGRFDANPFNKFDTIPGKLVISGTFMQQNDEDLYNFGFSIFEDGTSGFFVHTILNQIIIDPTTNASSPQAVEYNDPEAIPMKVMKIGDKTLYKSVLNAWPDTFVKLDANGKVIDISFLKPVTKINQDPKVGLKDYTYSGQKARIMLDTDI